MSAYDRRFYDTIREGTQRSAQRLVPILMDRLGLGEGSRVVDVGCGEGWWAHTFQQHGCEAWGIDGAYVESSPLGDRFVACDLNVWVGMTVTFDVAVCLEVAEHLPQRRAEGFVAELCTLAPIVVFSAAVPGQGGTGHVNEQWPWYWADHFAANGYSVSGALRFDIWDDILIENWYRQNLLIAVRSDRAAEFADLFESPVAEPISVVHPVLYEARRRP